MNHAINYKLVKSLDVDGRSGGQLTLVLLNLLIIDVIIISNF
jgi:hypothetical protein